MGLKFNNTDIYAVTYNGTSLTQINYNGTAVWYALTGCTISGTASQGSTLTCTVTPSEVQSLCSFQWYRGDTAISGATSSTYTIVNADRTYQLHCVATIGSASVTSNNSATVVGWHYLTSSWYATIRSNGEPSSGSNIGTFSYNGKAIKLASVRLTMDIYNKDPETWVGSTTVSANGIGDIATIQDGNDVTVGISSSASATSFTFHRTYFSSSGCSADIYAYVLGFYAWE